MQLLPLFSTKTTTTTTTTTTTKKKTQKKTTTNKKKNRNHANINANAYARMQYQVSMDSTLPLGSSWGKVNSANQWPTTYLTCSQDEEEMMLGTNHVHLHQSETSSWTSTMWFFASKKCPKHMEQAKWLPLQLDGLCKPSQLYQMSSCMQLQRPMHPSCSDRSTYRNIFAG